MNKILFCISLMFSYFLWIFSVMSVNHLSLYGPLFRSESKPWEAHLELSNSVLLVDLGSSFQDAWLELVSFSGHLNVRMSLNPQFLYEIAFASSI